MNGIRVKVNFFDWFEKKYNKKFISTIDRTIKTKTNQENNEIIHKELPQYESLILTDRATQLVPFSYRKAS